MRRVEAAQNSQPSFQGQVVPAQDQEPGLQGALECAEGKLVARRSIISISPDAVSAFRFRILIGLKTSTHTIFIQSAQLVLSYSRIRVLFKEL